MRAAYALDVFDPDGEDVDAVREGMAAVVLADFPDPWDWALDDAEDGAEGEGETLLSARCHVCADFFAKGDKPALVYVARPLPRSARDGRSIRVGPICGRCAAEKTAAEIDRRLAALSALWAKADAERLKNPEEEHTA